LDWLDTIFGVTPAYADAASIQPKGVRYAEFSGQPWWKRFVPGRDKELGVYQITPGAFQDLQTFMPEKWGGKNYYLTAVVDPWAEEAMRDYFSLLETRYAPYYGIQPTDENLLQMFNLGAKGFASGKRNPAYVKTYYEGLRR
jgi:hypothetical protein